MEKVRYEEMLPHEIVARRKTFPAAFIGLGGLEWHGEHLAVGNDALKAEKLCELAAARSGGFAFPTLWYGEPRVAALMEVNHDEDGGIRRKMGLPEAQVLTRPTSADAGRADRVLPASRLPHAGADEHAGDEGRVPPVRTLPAAWVALARGGSKFNRAVQGHAGVRRHRVPLSRRRPRRSAATTRPSGRPPTCGTCARTAWT